MTDRTLVVVSAGLSQPSTTRLLADRLAAATVSRLDDRATVKVIELRAHAVDIAHNLVTGFPSAALKSSLDAVTSADGLIAVTPIFAASYSGLFKSFFDILDDGVLADRPVLIAATGGTVRHSLALEHAVRPLFAYLRALVAPTAVFAAADDWAGAAADHGALSARVDRAAGELARLVSLREPTKPVDPFALPAPFTDLLS